MLLSPGYSPMLSPLLPAGCEAVLEVLKSNCYFNQTAPQGSIQHEALWLGLVIVAWFASVAGCDIVLWMFATWKVFPPVCWPILITLLIYSMLVPRSSIQCTGGRMPLIIGFSKDLPGLWSIRGRKSFYPSPDVFEIYIFFVSRFFLYLLVFQFNKSAKVVVFWVDASFFHRIPPEYKCVS